MSMTMTITLGITMSLTMTLAITLSLAWSQSTLPTTLLTAWAPSCGHGQGERHCYCRSHATVGGPRPVVRSMVGVECVGRWI